MLLLLFVAFGGLNFATGPKRLYVVEESANRTPAEAALFVKLQTEWPEGAVLILDKDNEQAPDAGGVKLPALVVTDTRGRVVWRGPLPDTVEKIKRRGK